jgi:DNA ligase-associated metallophosphoesterase
MSMLSGHRSSPRARRAGAGEIACLPGAHGLGFALAGAAVEALPEGALWVAAEAALIVSDLHLEKGSAFGVRGQFLPPYDTRAALGRLSGLIERVRPGLVVALGDSFHDVGGPERMDAVDAAALRGLTARTDWVWIEGNHDPEVPGWLGGRAAQTLSLAGLTLRHEPSGAAGEIAGHLHPCAKVSGRGRSVRARCFATDGARLVMPAFGAYAGGLNVCDDAFAALFPLGCAALMLGRQAVHPAPWGRLIPDA